MNYKCSICDKEPDIGKCGIIGKAGSITVKLAEFYGDSIDDGGYAFYSGSKLQNIHDHYANDTLRASGESWNSLSNTGRLLFVTPVICNACGIVNLKKKIAVNYEFGCVWIIVIGLISNILPAVIFFDVIIKLFRMELLVSMILMIMMCFIIMILSNIIFSHLCNQLLSSFLLKFVFNKKQPAIELKDCKNCHGTDFTPVDALDGKTMICPRCHNQTMEYKRSGYTKILEDEPIASKN
jgi:hypothetical protein